ncbi:MAG: sodium-translocating pyrophosphatase [Nitrososphaerota archaeon]
MTELFPIAASLAALLAALAFGVWLRRQPAGGEDVRRISEAVREGALAFLKKEVRIILPLAVIIVALVALFIHPYSALAFALGAGLSIIAGVASMLTCVSAAPKAAMATNRGLGRTMLTSFRGGATAGMVITSMALLAVSTLYLFIPNPVLIAGAGFGASLVALFIRAGGGIYTKAADLGADLVGKLEAGIPEDDPRNPATIADNVGDNVGDAAGMGADIYESYVVTLLASMLLGSIVGRNDLTILPLLVGGAGLLATVVGIMVVSGREPKNPMSPLNLAFMASAILAVLLGSAVTLLTVDSGGFGLAIVTAIILGTALVPIIQRITDYYTSYNYPPVKTITASTSVGHSANILEGVGQGLKSTLPLALSIIAAILTSYFTGLTATGSTVFGIYCTAITTMSMLSLSGVVLSIDSFGPVSDNAGGIVEMTGMGEENRRLTDKLDAVGNTAKATTKGFAIASAALAAIAMIQAFQKEAEAIFGTLDYSLSNPVVVVGLLVGALLPFYISSRLIAAVSATATKIVDEVRRQFREISGILEGKAKPDYGRCVGIATSGAIKELLTPAAIVALTPIIVGILLGPAAVAGVLTGGVLSGLYLAYHMANSGAAWDNAKKYLEVLGKKKTPEHAVAVAGDLVGDPYKDTAGPSLNTVIKVLNTVSIVFVSAFIGLLLW